MTSLSKRQGRAIAALIEHSTLTKAADAVGVTTRTLRNWLTDPDFAAAYESARRELVANASTRLQAALPEAVDVLCELARNRKAHPSVRLGAAKAVIEFGFRGTEIDDLQRRMAALEQEERTP